MKTITDLFRSLFSARRKEMENRAIQSHSIVTEKANENLNILSTLKKEKHETEDHEMAGVPGVDHTTDRKLPSENQKDSDASEQAGKTGGESGGTAGDVKEGEKEANAKPLTYEQGLIDGRNSKIEEIYFPREDDGIPRFRGFSPKQRQTPDIFSVAREA